MDDEARDSTSSPVPDAKYETVSEFYPSSEESWESGTPPDSFDCREGRLRIESLDPTSLGTVKFNIDVEREQKSRCFADVNQRLRRVKRP